MLLLGKKDYAHHGEKEKAKPKKKSLSAPDLPERLKLKDNWSHFEVGSTISNRADLIILKSCQEGTYFSFVYNVAYLI